MSPGSTEGECEVRAEAPKRRLSNGQRWLAAGVIITGIALVPLTFVNLFVTVNELLRQTLHFWAWNVPVATEVGFTGLFLGGWLLATMKRDLAWLRLVPWILAALSAFLNVYAAHGKLPAIAGHLAVVLTFFGYLLAAEAIVRRLTEDAEALRLASERRSACAYARDLLTDRKGAFWRWRTDVPSLLKRQIMKGRLPADVTASLAAGPASWEPAVRKFVIGGLTAGAWMASEERVVRRQIEASAKPVADAEASPQPRPQASPRKGVSEAERKRVKVRRLLEQNLTLPEGERLTLREIAGKAGVSDATVDRVKASMPTPLAPRREARG